MTTREDTATAKQMTALPVLTLEDPAGVAAFLVERLGMA
ncbi:MAG: hypothetical protein FD149_619 [Rhodospirillaceae bacterium]|nr:MAG: hypothetical protein FD149_619 [Rhodospirillaceae bacterium]